MLSAISITRRVRALLIGDGIQTLDDLCAKTETYLLGIKGFKSGSLRDVREGLAHEGLALTGDPLPEWLLFGPIARERCQEQCQYASRYVDGKLPGYPALGQGLRFQGDTRDYHSLRIHRGDVEEFVRRWQANKGRAASESDVR
jgi:hypothetical protein